MEPVTIAYMIFGALWVAGAITYLQIMAEEKKGLDKFRDLYLPTVKKYEKKLADTLSYFAVRS